MTRTPGMSRPDPSTSYRPDRSGRPGTRGRLAYAVHQGRRRTAAFAMEGRTGCRYISEEMDKVGVTAHSAEPADTSALRGPKRRVKTDNADAKPGPAQDFLAVENADIASYVAEVKAETLSHLALSWV